jgi:hypothetical protein
MGLFTGPIKGLLALRLPRYFRKAVLEVVRKGFPGQLTHNGEEKEQPVIR